MKRALVPVVAGVIVALPLLGCIGGGNDSIPALGTVSGTVRDATALTPIASATVTVAGVSATTDTQGAFSLRAPAGQRTYSVAAEGYQSVRDVAVAVPANTTVTLDIRLQAGASDAGTVHGSVTEAGTGDPVSGATVTVGTVTTTTDSTGAYTLAGMPVGDQNVTFSKTGYQTLVRTLNVVAGGSYTLDVELTLATTGTVAGTVTDAASGQGLAGVTVSIEAVASTTTGTDGAYTLADVPSGTWTLQFAMTGYRTVQRTVSVTATNTTIEDVPMMSPSQGTIEGRVRNRTSGALLGGVSVTIAELERSTSTSSDTGTLGEYQILGVATGTYSLTFSHPDYVTQTVADVAVEGGQTEVVDVELDPAVGGVVGWVFERDATTGQRGDPISGATVRIGNEGAEFTTAADGHWAAHDLPADADGTEYTIYAWDATHRLGSVQVTITRGQIVQAPDLILDLAQ